jgi:hypothetical protein
MPGPDFDTIVRQLTRWSAPKSLTEREWATNPAEREELAESAEQEEQTDVREEISGLKAIILEVNEGIVGRLGALGAAVREVKEQHAGLRSDIAALVRTVQAVLEEMRETPGQPDDGERTARDTPKRESKAPGQSDRESGCIPQPSAVPDAVEHLTIGHVPGPFEYRAICRPAEQPFPPYPPARIIIDLPGAPDAQALWRRICEHFGSELRFYPTDPKWFNLGGLSETAFIEYTQALVSAGGDSTPVAP